MDLIDSWNENKPFVEASNACTRWKNVNEDKKVNDRLVEDRVQKCPYNMVHNLWTKWALYEVEIWLNKNFESF